MQLKAQCRVDIKEGFQIWDHSACVIAQISITPCAWWAQFQDQVWAPGGQVAQVFIWAFLASSSSFLPSLSHVLLPLARLWGSHLLTYLYLYLYLYLDRCSHHCQQNIKRVFTVTQGATICSHKQFNIPDHRGDNVKPVYQYISLIAKTSNIISLILKVTRFHTNTTNILDSGGAIIKSQTAQGR